MHRWGIDPVRLAISGAVVGLICLWYATVTRQLTFFGLEEWTALTGVLIYVLLVPAFLLHALLGNGAAHEYAWGDIVFSACIVGFLVYGFLSLVGRLSRS